MGDTVLALICVASILGAATSFGFAFRHHLQLLTHDQQRPPK